MNKLNPYTIFNDITTEEEYLPLSEQQTKRLMSHLPSKRKRKWVKPVIAIATAAAILLMVGSTGLAKTAFANMNLRISQLNLTMSQGTGKQKDIDNYATDVQKMVYTKDFAMKLNAVAVDGRELLITYTVEPFKQVDIEKAPMPDLIGVQINGKNAHVFGGGGSYGPVAGEKNLYSGEMTYQMEEPFPSGKINLQLDFSQRDHFIGHAMRYNLETSQDELNKDTEIQNINQDIGDSYHLEKLHFNPMRQAFVITTKKIDEASHSEYVLIGYDEFGRKVEFGQRTGEKIGDNYELKVVFEPVVSKLTDQQLLKESKKLTLQLYRISLPEGGGKIDSDKKIAVGEAIVINRS